VRAIRIQPEPFVDQLTEDGHECTKLPYAFVADETGAIAGQDFWQGIVARVIGFQKDLAVQHIDLFWREVLDDPQRAVGMYLVTSDSAGDWGVHDTAIRDMTILQED
jgi:hypothetical protein